MILTFAKPEDFWLILAGIIVVFIVIPALISHDHKNDAKFYQKTVDDLVYLCPRLKDAFPKYYEGYGFEYGKFGHSTVQRIAQTKREASEQRLNLSDLREAEAILEGKVSRNKHGEVVPNP